jgi:hypothetical protein
MEHLMSVLCCFLILGVAALFRSLTGGSIQGATSIQVKGTAAPQGTASSSTLQSLATTVTGSAQESLTYGTGSGQVNLIVAQDRTLAASSNETLDLYGSTTPLADIFGANALFRHIKYIAVYIVANGDVSGLLVGGAGSDPFLGPLGGTSPTVLIYPNGPGYQLGEPTVGWGVTSSAGQLKITNESSAVSVTYRIVIGGTTT